MKIAIAGAGMTGAYLYRLLSKERHTVEIFDRGAGTRCGINPCAWGTSNDFPELVRAAGLDPAEYILAKSDHILIDEVSIPANLMTVDKPRLIEDLLAGAAVSRAVPDPGRYDRIIDATGAARAFLPPISDDIVLACAQWRLATATPLGNRIELGGIGYGWSFPLSPGEYHVGCGSLLADPLARMREIGWIHRERDHVRCACRGSIRLTGPRSALPFVVPLAAGEVWGIGEAIGCVAPLAGDGIIPGMKSVQTLLKWWHDPAGYTGAILDEFKWMEDERCVIDKLRKGDSLTLREARVLKQNAKRMGMKVGLKEAASLLAHVR